jgi:hypothetical protein
MPSIAATVAALFLSPLLQGILRMRRVSWITSIYRLKRVRLDPLMLVQISKTWAMRCKEILLGPKGKIWQSGSLLNVMKFHNTIEPRAARELLQLALMLVNLGQLLWALLPAIPHLDCHACDAHTRFDSANAYQIEYSSA